MKTQTICQHCVYQTHPEMMTGYCITGPCERCGRVTRLAISCHAEEITSLQGQVDTLRKVAAGWECPRCGKDFEGHDCAFPDCLRPPYE